MQALMRFYRHGVPFYRSFVSIGVSQMLSTKYRLFFANTDAIHIETFEQKKWSLFYGDFTTCFEKSISFEIGMQKAKLEIYVLNEHDLQENALYSLMIKKKMTLRFTRVYRYGIYR
jgi:hypothetical protein